MKEFLKKLKLNEDQLSNVLTVVVFVLVGILLFNYFKSVNKPAREQTTSANTEVTEQKKKEMTVEQAVKSGLPAEYTIKKGDSLWKISTQAYGTGYNWTDIYNSNRQTLKDPDILPVGTKLTLPKVEEKVVTYTVVQGDNMWNIAMAKCGNGFAYSSIASANSISNPRIIEPGMKLTIRCK